MKSLLAKMRWGSVLKITIAVFLLLSPASLAWADDADIIFDDSTLATIRLAMNPDDWDQLRERYREEIWFPATFQWQDEVVQNVGVRSRGGGTRNDTKPGLKITFDKYVRNQAFHGVKSLDLKNQFQDPAMMREQLAAKVFQAQGIASPRVVSVRLYVNDDYRGLYALIEPVDKTFLRARFAEDKGNLFKYEWKDYYYFEWKGSDPSNYIPAPFNPKTNETTLNPAGLVNLIDRINNASANAIIQGVDSYLGLEKVFMYLAIENALVELDGTLGGWGLDNFYLYQFDNTDSFVFVPWDRDLAFSYWTRSIFYNTDKVVLTQRAFRFPELRELYLQRLEETVTNSVNERALLPRIESLYNQIRESALEDSYKPYSNEEFEMAVDDLRAFARAREAEVRRQVAAARQLGPHDWISDDF